MVTLRAGNESVVVHLERDRHKTVRLKVKPDGTVLVRAPQRSRPVDVLNWLTGRTAWILERQAYFQRLRATLPPLGYNSGDIQRFLGRDYPVHIAEHVRGSVRLDEQGFHIQTRGAASESKVRALLDRWFEAQARTLFAERLALWFPALQTQAGEPRLEIPPPLKIRAMRSRFGSCNCRGVITLNRRLATTPLACIDYVLVHELCHLRHFAHNRPFYELLEELMPDWQERKSRLKEYWVAQF